jgi:hypothetical protein
MLRLKLFDGVEKEIKVYNTQAIVDLDIQLYSEECDDDLLVEEEDFTFPGYASSYFRIYNERLGTRLKNISLSRSGGSLILNASVLDMTFDQNGKYYYEIGYVNSVYETVLVYGKLKVV